MNLEIHRMEWIWLWWIWKSFIKSSHPNDPLYFLCRVFNCLTLLQVNNLCQELQLLASNRLVMIVTGDITNDCSNLYVEETPSFWPQIGLLWLAGDITVNWCATEGLIIRKLLIFLISFCPVFRSQYLCFTFSFICADHKLWSIMLVNHFYWIWSYSSRFWMFFNKIEVLIFCF